MASLAEPEDRAATTAALSERTRTVELRQDLPHKATAMTTGTSSLAAIWYPAHDSGHWSWNHELLDPKPPHPHDPDASAVIVCWGAGGCSIDLPFHLGRNVAHHCRSERNSWDSLTWWWA